MLKRFTPEYPVFRRDQSREAYLQLLGKEADEELPSLEEMPEGLVLPEEVLTYFRDILETTKQSEVECKGFVWCDSEELQFSSMGRGVSDWKKRLFRIDESRSTSVSEHFIKAAFKNPFLIALHSHTSESSNPSWLDLKTYELAPDASFINGIISEDSVTLLVKTKESKRKFPFQWVFRTIKALSKTGKAMMEEEWNAYEADNMRERISKAWKVDMTEKEKGRLRENLSKRTVEICEDNGWAFYQFEGDIMGAEDEEIVFERLRPEGVA